MNYSWQALAAAWLVVFGLFGLIASQTVTGRWGLLLVFAALAVPAAILAIDERRRRA